jgi:hypothetical protein
LAIAKGTGTVRPGMFVRMVVIVKRHIKPAAVISGRDSGAAR